MAWLIAHGADVNASSAGGRTTAYFAAERNTSPKTLALLDKHGAHLTVRDADGQTPLEIARLNGKSRLVEWLAIGPHQPVDATDGTPFKLLS